MTKSELISRIAERFSALTVADANAAVELILSKMTRALTSGDRIEIRGFGSFALNYRPPRRGRNPKSGEKVNVPGKHVPHFKAGKELRDRVDAAAVDAAAKRPKYTLDQLMAQCDGNAASPRVTGWDEMVPVGKEIV